MTTTTTKKKPALVAVTPEDAARAEFQNLNDEMRAAFPERDAIVWQMLISLVAGQHVLLVGPPGTAKSKMTRTLCNALGASWFDTLCNRFQVPAEVMGPYDPKAIADEGRLVRKAENYLPTAQVAFLDEIFKGSSAILNSLLEALNERTWTDDGQKKDMPLLMVVGASNEMAGENDGLLAFDDRMLSRFFVPYLKDERNIDRLIRRELPSVTAKLSLESVRVMAELAKTVTVSDDAVAALKSILASCRDKGIAVSDRKLLGQSIDLLKAHAALRGMTEVTSASLAPLEHVLWTKPDEQATVREIVRAFVAEWIKEVRSIQEVIDEANARLAKGLREAKTRGAKLKVVAKVNDDLDALGARLEKLERESPDAEAEVNRLRDLIAGIFEEMKSASRSLGF